MRSASLPCERFICEAVETVGCILWHAYNTPGKKNHITVLIDKEGGANLGDCEKVMDQLQGTYALLNDYLKNCAIDVATPGLDRTLYTKEHYNKSLKKFIEVKGNQVITDDQKKNIRGYLIACGDESITLECSEDRVYNIPYSAMIKSRWIYTATPYNREEPHD